MTHSDTKSRYKKQLFFSMFIVSVSCLLYFTLPNPFEIEKTSYLFDVLGVIAFLIIWQLGVPMPYIGLVSMERVIQFFLLLTIDFHQAAIINAIAAMIWPFINKKYSQSSFKLSLVKSIHNAGMVSIMVLVTGSIMYNFISIFPVSHLNQNIIIGLLVTSISIQVLNFSILGTFYRLDGKKVSELFNYLNLIIEIIFVPLGVLAAILFNLNEMNLFTLLALFTITVLFAFHSNAFVQRERVDLRHIKKIGYDHNNLLSVTKDLANNIKSLLHFDSFYVALLNSDENEIEVVYQTHKKTRKPVGLIIREVEIAIESKSIHCNNNFQHGSSQSQSVLVTPLINHNGVYGAICLLSNSSDFYSVSDSTILREIADKYSMILSYARAYEILEHHSQKLENLVEMRTTELRSANSDKQKLLDELTIKSSMLKHLSEHDYLTDLYNRRYFNQIASQLNSVINVSVALIDLDHFKAVNDTYGHTVGDKVLIQVAALLKSIFIEDATIARYGGEEFIVLFEGVYFSRVKQLCEAFRLAIKSHNWGAIAENLSLTVSLGIEHSTENQTIAQVIDQSDQNLYRAKDLGRNQIVTTKDSK
jgi:diguanylate cyclase (GGDEF)-like protein